MSVEHRIVRCKGIKKGVFINSLFFILYNADP